MIKVACRVQIWQKFFENSEKFGNSFIKNDIVYMSLSFIYKNPIISSLLKIVALKFTMYILTVLLYSLKLYVIGK